MKFSFCKFIELRKRKLIQRGIFSGSASIYEVNKNVLKIGFNSVRLNLLLLLWVNIRSMYNVLGWIGLVHLTLRRYTTKSIVMGSLFLGADVFSYLTERWHSSIYWAATTISVWFVVQILKTQRRQNANHSGIITRFSIEKHSGNW